MDKIGIPYVLTGGALLGLWRDGGVMAHDVDIDVDVLVEDVGDIKKFLKRFKKATGKEDAVFHDNYFTAKYEYPEQIVPFDVFLMFKKGNKRY